jgi:ribosomal protein S18 acetylase RimI-like enzyme
VPAIEPGTAGIEIRVAIPDDALCLGVLGTQVFLDTYAKDGIRPAIANEALEHFSTSTLAAALARPETVFLVAERGEHLVGFAQLTMDARLDLLPPGKAAELHRLYVQRPYLGFGIGKGLLREAESLAAAKGTRWLWLTAWVGNAPALTFYRKQGYEEIGSNLYVYRGDEYETRVFLQDLEAASSRRKVDQASTR